MLLVAESIAERIFRCLNTTCATPTWLGVGGLQGGCTRNCTCVGQGRVPSSHRGERCMHATDCEAAPEFCYSNGTGYSIRLNDT